MLRVVSLPSTDVFDAQDEAWRESVLPSDVSARVAVEAGIADYWYKYVGLKGKIVGADRLWRIRPGRAVVPVLWLYGRPYRRHRRTGA